MTRTELLALLADTLRTATDGRLILDPGRDADSPLRELGLDSIGLLNFLVALEDALGVEWDPSTPREAFRSLGAIATLLTPAESALSASAGSAT